MRRLIVFLGLMLLLTPLGLLATGEAWGEWAPEDLAEALGYVPRGLSRLSGFWRWAPMPDYSLPALPEPVGYALSGLVGALLVAGLIWLVVPRGE